LTWPGCQYFAKIPKQFTVLAPSQALSPAQQPSQQDLIHPPTKSLVTVDYDYRDAGRVLRDQFRIGIDIDGLRLQAMLDENVVCLVTQMTSLTRVKDRFVSRHTGDFQEGGVTWY